MRPDPANTAFQQAVAFVNQTNRHLFVTGNAGTGKTTFLRYIKENCFKKMAVVAPTGVAAINAGGVTIHSFFQIPPGNFLPTDSGMWDKHGDYNNRTSLLKHLRLRAEKRELLQELDMLVIDEISMVRADLLDAIDTVLRHVRRQHLVPFGGVQMLYIGDLFQLPPVVNNNDWQLLRDYYNSPFFFDAQALRHAAPMIVELKKIYRQKDDVFINILNNIRNNCCTAEDLEVLHRNYNPSFVPAKDEDYITLTSHNAKADAINERELEKLPGKLFTYEAAIKDDFGERSYPAEKALRLKQGAQIMFIKNDKGEERKFYNGKLATIKEITAEKIVVAFAGEESELQLERETWRNIDYHYNAEEDTVEQEELGSFTQYPIRLAWAITIHKSQGLTFEKAIVDAGASFAPGQVYVSLSRLTSLKGLVLQSQIHPRCISTDERVIAFAKRVLHEDQLQQALEKDAKLYVRQQMLQCFQWQKVTDALHTHLEKYESRKIPEKEKCIEWATLLCEAVVYQQDVADKFIKLLEYLLTDCTNEGMQKLNERTIAATNFFLQEIEDKLQTPVTTHIDEVKNRKQVKKYVKELQALTVFFSRKKQQLQQALQLSEIMS